MDQVPGRTAPNPRAQNFFCRSDPSEIAASSTTCAAPVTKLNHSYRPRSDSRKRARASGAGPFPHAKRLEREIRRSFEMQLTRLTSGLSGLAAVALVLTSIQFFFAAPSGLA
jgi:hypothetical protein